ncbi:NAD-dependent epimerase/dehydratase family protein [Marisediminicola senii]|uniref:NAD-dependent epimerase/dehydratase family protein n=1 Tax=Marisediminicola senii TaxID=2711233 RepID=UPI0013ECC7A1|nr:NAD(P)-dependent oxidoreductase [Marisediminicola senii]
MKIAVTGATGKLGSVVVPYLREAGHTVAALDIAGDREAETFTRVDFTDYGQTVDAFSGIDDRHDGVDALVHLAAVPAGGIVPDSRTFHNNMTATFNVFQAARRVGISTIAYASSETLLGIPFETPPPYLPVDEEYPSRPESMYAVTKHLEEELAQKLVRWNPELSISALRFSNVMHVGDYAKFPEYDLDATSRKWNLWGYIDARDGAQAVLRALEARIPGFAAYIIANADTVMSRKSADLAAEVYPGVEVIRELGDTESLLSIEKARRVLGYEPVHSWRDHV